MKRGLRQRILSATSEDEVRKLMEEGKTYEFASIRTKNSWKSAAHRVVFGKKPQPVETNDDVIIVTPKKKKAKKHI